jgi:hypothetical protein
MTRRDVDRLLKRRGLTELHGPEVNRAFEAFRKRCAGLEEVAWQTNSYSPAAIAAAFQQFGFDCYTQGLMDATDIALRFPHLLPESNQPTGDCT